MDKVKFSSHSDLHLKATELRLDLPGTQVDDEQPRSNKRSLYENGDGSFSKVVLSRSTQCDYGVSQSSKAQIVGWPPIRSYRKNTLQSKEAAAEGSAIGGEVSGFYVKVSMDGAPFLRKIDLKLYKGYPDFLKALESMFKLTIGQYSEREGYKGSDYAPTYEDEDGDLMLVGDVPWDMFVSSCKKLRIKDQRQEDDDR